VSTDLKGNMLVLGPDKGYSLKMVPLNPKEYIGVGMEIEEIEDLRKAVGTGPSYGFRPISLKYIKQLNNNISRGNNQSELFSELLSKKPLPTWELEKQKPNAILHGPIISKPNLTTLSEKQRKLESKLKMEANKLFRDKYPHRAAIYT
jgi:hypothetical protein